MDSRRGVHESYAQLESNDAIVSRLAQQDKVPWYSKPNLRVLYFLIAPTCIGVEMTSGQVIALRWTFLGKMLTRRKI
ncbi:hypothetical protein OG21DRAFT_1506201 [Imleria badia]|nr:hypothetical protein OG21DRAFT_1506201 [Imleria badia]